MTDLSPAAQAVMDAYRKRYAETLRPGPFVDYWQEVCAAAALRAAADRLDHAASAHTLYAIATELKNQS